MNMASPRPQPESDEPQLWSRLPPEILGLILSNLGKHDLLTSRMVSHVWNEESLKVLRKSKFTQLLREENIKEYIHFTATSDASQPRPFIIPFHLDFRISFSSGDWLEPKSPTPYVKSLCQTFGPQCVSTLKLRTNTIFFEQKINEIGLPQFLALISLGLKTLDLKGTYSSVDFLQNQNSIIRFPTLKKLICNTDHWSWVPEGVDPVEQTYFSIIENSPKLDDLTIAQHAHPYDLESWPLNFNQLKSLCIDTLVNPQSILDKILAISEPPVLQELRFTEDVSWTDEDKIVVYNILNSVSSTLKSLTIREHLFEPRTLTQIMRFPRLPYLEHLGLEFSYGFEFNLDGQTFPSLKSIELPTGFTFIPSHVQSQDNEEVKVEFPNLVKLILRMGNSVRQQDLIGTMENLQKIFSTPTKLSLVNVGGNHRVKYLLDRILKSNWSKNIQEFEMIGFNQDYLGQTLDGLNELDSVKMKNLIAIKLEFIDDGCYYGGYATSSTPRIPNLIQFGGQFPQLRMIEVSEVLFHDESMWRYHILEFKSTFPNVFLNVT